VRKCEELYYIK